MRLRRRRPKRLALRAVQPLPWGGSPPTPSGRKREAGASRKADRRVRPASCRALPQGPGPGGIPPPARRRTETRQVWTDTEMCRRDSSSPAKNGNMRRVSPTSSWSEVNAQLPRPPAVARKEGRSAPCRRRPRPGDVRRGECASPCCAGFP